MAKLICLWDLHLDDLIHIYVRTKNTCNNESSLQLAHVLTHHLVFFSKIPNLASTIFTGATVRLWCKN